MADKNSLIKVDPISSAYHLREVGGWGVAIIFLLLLYGVWKFFTKRINDHATEMRVQREAHDAQVTDLSNVLEQRHEQFIKLIKDNQTTSATAVEQNRQINELMSRIEDTMREVNIRMRNDD